MMQNLRINLPFTGEVASASELFHRALPPLLPHLSLPSKVPDFATWLNVCLLKQASKCPHIPYRSTHTTDAHQHQVCFLPPTPIYPAFLIACSEPLKTNQREQKGNLCIKLLRDRCSLTVGRRAGRFGEAIPPGAASVPDCIPGSFNPWRGQRRLFYSPSTAALRMPSGSSLFAPLP